MEKISNTIKLKGRYCLIKDIFNNLEIREDLNDDTKIGRAIYKICKSYLDSSELGIMIKFIEHRFEFDSQIMDDSVSNADQQMTQKIQDIWPESSNPTPEQINAIKTIVEHLNSGDKPICNSWRSLEWQERYYSNCFKINGKL